MEFHKSQDIFGQLSDCEVLKKSGNPGTFNSGIILYKLKLENLMYSECVLINFLQKWLAKLY
jgi:hypothetical protein